MTTEQTTLPALQGSEKQIAWAERIRTKRTAEAAEFRAENDAHMDRGISLGKIDAEKKTRFMAALDAGTQALFTEDSAAFWIDSRDKMFRDVLNPYALPLMQAVKEGR